MVRLKVRKDLTLKVGYEFQFHYGAIKSHRAVNGQKVEEEFQFHYGAIKRINHRVPSYALHNFNSTMVRLKSVAANDEALFINKFQFHYGAIKSWSRRMKILVMR